MSRRGTRKYRCEDCAHEGFEHWTARNRAALIRCPRCGSTYYELKTKKAKDDAADLIGYRRAMDETGSTGHVQVGNPRPSDRRHR